MSSMVYLFLQTAVKALSGLLALFALVAAGALFLRKARVSALARLKKGVLLVLLACAVVAAVIAQKDTSRAPARSPRNAPMALSDDGERSLCGPTNLRFTAIGVSSNSVWMSLAWPDGFLAGGDRLDVFSVSSLPCPDDLLPADDVSGLGWRWRAGHIVADGSTNVTLSVDVAAEGERPSAQFFRAVVSPLPPVPDADGDGLADAVDPEPQIAGADAHGANAEWYGVVCPNVFMKASPEGPTGSAVTLPNGETVHFRPDVNERAYYFVEVVAERGPAEVRFSTDTPGRLGSPIVVARTGEICLVPLLIGAEYAVTSAVPIAVCAPDAAYAEIVTNGPAGHTVKWPLEFVDVEDSPGVHVMDVRPYDPGGTFTWSRGTVVARLAASASDDGGCPYTVMESTVVFGCNGSDGCACGGCVVYATYGLEGNTFYGGSVACGCTPDDDDHISDPPHDEPDWVFVEPRVTVYFSKDAVIFEDEYQNEVGGEVQPRRSTTTRLVIHAEAGSVDSVVTISPRNLGKLRNAEGGEIGLPPFVLLAPGDSYYLDVACGGVEASADEDDVAITTTIENLLGNVDSGRAALTVVKVDIQPKKAAPANASVNRHRLGVYELVDCRHAPDVSGVAWTLEGGGTTNNAPEGFVENLPGLGVLRCPLTSNGATLKVSCGDADYWPLVQFVEPNDIVAERVDYRFDGERPMGAAGGVSLVTSLYVHPKDVNFEEIALEEIPWEQGGSVSGYYAQPSKLSDRFHDGNHGAGKWRVVKTGNFWWRDVAGSKAITNWCEGVKVWDAPIGWNVKGATDDDDYVEMIGSSSRFRQMFTIGSDGTFRLDKFGHWVSRGVSTNPEGPENGQIVLDGSVRNILDDIDRWREENNQGENVEILP